MSISIECTTKIMVSITNRCPLYIFQIQIRVKRYNRIGFSVILTIINVCCKLRQFINRSNAYPNRPVIRFFGRLFSRFCIRLAALRLLCTLRFLRALCFLLVCRKCRCRQHNKAHCQHQQQTCYPFFHIFLLTLCPPDTIFILGS